MRRVWPSGSCSRALCSPALCLAALLAGCADPLAGLTVVGDDPSDAPLAGLDEATLRRFEAGDALFEQPFRASQGLGPVYIRHACVSCHEDDARGPGAVRKMVLLDPDGVVSEDQSALVHGHTVRPQRAAGATRGVEPPADREVWITRRFGPPVFARGYLEAIDDAEIERVEAEQAREGVVSGRVHRVAWQSEANPLATHGLGPGATNLIGRFGLKARLATLDEFVADAFQGDMGLTSPLRPRELSNPDGLLDDAREGVDLDAESIELVTDYVRLLAIPARAAPPEGAAALFAEVGCARCHVPTLRTRADYPIAALADVDAPVFSDLLLHDMGEGLADGLRDGDALGSEWRTAPLIGLRHQRALLHDGRASTALEAIEAHDGEARGAAEAFAALPEAARYTLLRYVEGL